MPGSRAYRRPPGQAVKLASRCPAIAGNLTFCPVAYFWPYPHTSSPVPRGSTWCTSSFHASSCSSEVTARVGGAESVKVPMTEMPVLPVLKPSTCAPTTPRETPPERPSYTVP